VTSAAELADRPASWKQVGVEVAATVGGGFLHLDRDCMSIGPSILADASYNQNLWMMHHRFEGATYLPH